MVKQVLAVWQVRLFAEERRINRKRVGSAGRAGSAGTLDASQSLSPHAHELPSLKGSGSGGHTTYGSERSGAGAVLPCRQGLGGSFAGLRVVADCRSSTAARRLCPPAEFQGAGKLTGDCLFAYQH